MTANRLMDILLSVIGLVFLAPLMLIVAVAIRVDSPGPILFRQQRVGKLGRLFRIHKFRTMGADAAANGPDITIGDDPRVTRVGRFLRRYKLDELPQLLDVLQGNMTLVGPRPEIPRYVALYDVEQQRVLKLTPGLTDIASIVYREESRMLAEAEDPHKEYVTRIMPHKICLNLEYASRATLLSDLGIILRTLAALFCRHDESGRKEMKTDASVDHSSE